MPAQLVPVIILPFQCECAVIACLADFKLPDGPLLVVYYYNWFGQKLKYSNY